MASRGRGNRIYINIICNILILVMLISVFSVSFSREMQTAFSSVAPPKYRGNEDKAQVSLMINVYWGNEYIPQMLQTLKEQDVKATFFIGGMWADKNPELLCEISKNGHEIANHGYFHKDGDKMTEEGNTKEIQNAENMIYAMCGQKTDLFAPPSGAYSTATLKSAEALGYTTIMWSKDTIDWRDKDKTLIYKRATTNQQNGDLILMHPTSHTAEVLEDIIKTTKSNGFSIVSVSQNIAP